VLSFDGSARAETNACFFEVEWTKSTRIDVILDFYSTRLAFVPMKILQVNDNINLVPINCRHCANNDNNIALLLLFYVHIYTECTTLFTGHKQYMLFKLLSRVQSESFDYCLSAGVVTLVMGEFITALLRTSTLQSSDPSDPMAKVRL
jgi:hypothetical protein